MSFYEKVRNQKFLSFTVALFVLSLATVIGTYAQTGTKAAKDQAGAPDATPLVIPNESAVPNEYSRIAKMLEPSVVNIQTEYRPENTTSRGGGGRRCGPNSLNDLFCFFIRRLFVDHL